MPSAEDEADLRRRLDALVLGFRPDGTPLTGRELGSTGAVMALAEGRGQTHLVQSLEGNAEPVHGGPFANIAHGCNSVAATRAALSVADWAITEAGFGWIWAQKNSSTSSAGRPGWHRLPWCWSPRWLRSSGMAVASWPMSGSHSRQP